MTHIHKEFSRMIYFIALQPQVIAFAKRKKRVTFHANILS